MRARLGGVVCFVVAAIAVGAMAPASVLAESSIPVPVAIVYQGSYEYHEMATKSGAVVSYVNQNLGWSWSALGRVPISADGSREYGVENLRGNLSVSGASSSAASSSTGVNCTYSAGSGATTPIRVSVLDDFSLQAGYGLGIPGAASTCNGQASSPSDVLDCDFNSCDAGPCPGGPPAVSTDRFQTAVLSAFEPTTSYLKTGYLPLDPPHPGEVLGNAGEQYNLPAGTGSFTGSCQSNITETDTISITSQVFVTINTGARLSVDFPNSFPATPLTDLIALDPDLPSNPSISIPPDSPQLPDYPGLDDLTASLATKKTTSSGSNPAVGIISIRCPRHDRRCEGTFSVTSSGGAPRGVLGRRSYSVSGGEDEIVNVPLASSAGAVLNRVGRLRVRVAVSSDVMPGSSRSSGHRTVLLTRFPSIPGTPSG